MQDELFEQEEGLENIALLHNIYFSYFNALMHDAEKAAADQLRVEKLYQTVDNFVSHIFVYGDSPYLALVSARLAQHASPQ